MRRTTTARPGSWRARISTLGAALLFVAIAQPSAVSTTLVISQIYGGGGNTGAPFANDFVELRNRGAAPVALGGLSIQYASATGTGHFGAGALQSATLPNVVLAPGSYFLVQLAGGAVGAPLPTPDYIDADSPITMGGAAGKVALVTGTASLGCNGGSTPCAPDQLARIVDLVGYGGANFFEGAPTPVLSNVTAAMRIAGELDTDNNAADFAVAAPAPRNSASTTPEIPLTPISELQGAGAASPFTGLDVATRGIVTARKTNGFFMQMPDVEADAAEETSNALFVFTSTPPAVAVGDDVQVSGRLVEFRSASAATTGTLTEISGPSVDVLSSGNPLPAAVDAARFLSTPTAFASRTEQLERYESMLVATASLDVVGPTNTFGELYGVITGTARPFREPGLDVSDPLPVDAPPGLQRFDGNFERIMLDSDDLVMANGLRRPRLDLPVGTPTAPVRIGPVAGPLDYAFDNYRIALDATAVGVGSRAPEPVPAAGDAEFTVMSLNLENFRNGTPNFESRMQKASRLIVEVLRTPDVLGLIEVGDLANLQALAALVNAAAGTSYQAYLEDGDGQITGFEQNIGFLVNAARVEVFATRQEFRGKTFEFGGQTDLLHDRPPFLLEARIRHTGTSITVILNHLRSLIDVNSNAPFGSGGLTLGERVREKRRLQAEDLADLVAARPTENLIVMGDLNAFEFNDGLGDIVGTIAGTPAPAGYVTEPSVDRWTHELVDLATLLPAPVRYSYAFEGNAQVLDHVLVNEPMRRRLTRFLYARNNADFPESFASDFTATTRLSDHDGAAAYFSASTDLALTGAPPVDVPAGVPVSVQVQLSNLLDTAANPAVTFTAPAGLMWGSAQGPAGWTCARIGSLVRCRAAQLVSGDSVTFGLAAVAACSLPAGTHLQVTATSRSTTPEGNLSNNSATTDLLVHAAGAGSVACADSTAHASSRP